MSPAVTRVLRALGDCGLRRTGTGWQARCPAHEDRRASLNVSEGEEGRALIHCFAGCSFEEVLRARGLVPTDLMPERDRGQVPHAARIEPKGKRVVATYPYLDERGSALFEVVRFEPKDFRQRRPDGRGGWTYSLAGVRHVVYRLP
jgi:hypothetical protein